MPLKFRLIVANFPATGRRGQRLQVKLEGRARVSLEQIKTRQ